MIRLAAAAVIAVLADAIALVVTAQLLDDMSLDGLGFFVALAVFVVVQLLIGPLLRQIAVKNAPALLGSSALLATLASLIVTVLVTDGLRISGTLTWILATVLVWAISLAAQLLLPLVLFKKVLANRRS